jgi:hypothetical protein
LQVHLIIKNSHVLQNISAERERIPAHKYCKIMSAPQPHASFM